MSRIRVHSIAVSLDGYAAGPEQSIDAPMGVRGELLHPWVFDTAYGQTMIDGQGGTRGVDDEWLRRGDVGVGATVMGRNMFGPVRGPWPDDTWGGWWGDEPPYGHEVFVLTHFARAPLVKGRTTFHFVTDGLDAALDRARSAAGADDVRLAGGAAVVREGLRRGLVDEAHFAVVPTLLHAGEPLYDGVDPWPEGWTCVERESGEGAVHLRFVRD